ncbi:LysM domain protein [Metarhizium rileyi]|uniref:LysM domain protein n=1 Tax=Metarhizium rileyi (strain RCEF 4871) TaxID=1649241 RepID=A0A166Y2R4_METRR|nr:LysM domain protein [Metarhizium rileyi RCEF 4871]TWU70828.1 hypothetical protein ED733_000662 [Metarhizium rileyi]
MLGFTKQIILAVHVAAIATAMPGFPNVGKRDTWAGCLEHPTPTAPSTSTETPFPVRAPMAPNCNKFCLVPAGAWCDTVAQNNGITTEDFMKWNSYVGPECHALWAHYYACIGVTKQ